jgi:hypothetical protein
VSERVVIYFNPLNKRSKFICESMLEGIMAVGQKVDYLPCSDFRRVEHDVAIFYGLANGLRSVFAEYKKQAQAIYIDLGYWGRRKPARFEGYHKFSLNDRHPTAYFQNRAHDPSRFREHGMQIRPWRESGRHIVVVGMSGKGAATEGYAPQQWERETVERLRKLTRRPIIYRPKPNWLHARPIPGTIFQRNVELNDALHNCHAVVCHHSNVAVDALIQGIPAFCDEGIALPMAGTDLAMIEEPPMPDGREQWAADVAWTQWSRAEMEDGSAWRYLKTEVLK